MANKIHPGSLLAGLLLCLLSHSVFADSGTAADEVSSADVPAMPGESASADALPWPTVLSFSVGPSVIKTGQAQDINLPNGSNSYFHPQHIFQTETLFNLFLGTHWQFKPLLALESGIAYYQPTPFTIKGMESQNTAPHSYSYNFNVVPRAIYAEAKLIYNLKMIYHPWLSLALGESYNSAYRYQSNPAVGTAAPSFMNQNNHAFSYVVGIGFDRDIGAHLRAGISYRFMDFGNADLGLAAQNGSPFSPQSLLQNHLYTNAVMGQLSYIFV
jgi:hypothetical protein